jgi:hypothetical protein
MIIDTEAVGLPFEYVARLFQKDNDDTEQPRLVLQELNQ